MPDQATIITENNQKTEVSKILNTVFEKKEPNKDEIYLGLSGVEFEADYFDFGHGIHLKKTYAFVFAPYLVAFKKPLGPGEPSPGPWKVVSGGQSRYINYELYVPVEFEMSTWFDRVNTAWWILSLLRLKGSSLLIGSVISNYSFTSIGKFDLNANFITVEFNNDQMPIDSDVKKVISISDLNWVKDYWYSAGMLFRDNENFSNAYRAIDRSVHESRPSLSLVTIWGALERLFADFKQELNYRVSLNVSSFLEPIGDGRQSLFKRVKKLYESRSKAAHGRANEDYHDYKESYILLKRSLMKMIEQNHVPTMTDIEDIILRNKTSTGA